MMVSLFDQRLAVVKLNEAGYEPESSEEKAHSRMVNDCAWFPDGSGFVTASRDKTVRHPC